jgi:DNA-binding response OmpR family regulator
MRALLVDDEPVVRRVLARMLRALRAEGFDVHEAEDGDGLEARVDALQPDLIVLDVVLPGRSGIELLAALRDSGDGRPVLLSSGHAAVAAKVAAPELDPTTRFLPKPYDVRLLREHLRALLSSDHGD